MAAWRKLMFELQITGGSHALVRHSYEAKQR